MIETPFCASVEPIVTRSRRVHPRLLWRDSCVIRQSANHGVSHSE